MRTILQSAGVLIAVLTVLAPAGIEAEAIILNDGGVHTISGPSDPVAVSNSTTLIIQDGAVITGGTPSVSIDQTSRVTITDGSITGGNFSDALSSAGAATISGGTFQGGFSLSGGTGASISGPAMISGGTFRGGSGRLISGGTGASISGPATISGGTFQGGGSVGTGASISGPATISGGTFQSGGSGGTGASISGPATISGGTFQGRSGPFGGFGAFISGPATISGGTFASPIRLNLFDDEVDFFGTLIFTNDRLTGVLADGTSLDQTVTLSPGITVLSSPGEVRFLGPNAVPEPTSLVLLGTGLIGPLGVWWLSRRRTHIAGGVSAR